jgi:hypothetical protein
MVVSWFIVSAVCILSGQYSRAEEQREWSMFRMSGQLPNSSAAQQSDFQGTKIQF